MRFLRSGGGAGMPGPRRRRDRPRDQHQRVADEAGRDRAGVLRGKFIAPRILVGQLGLDLELDRHQVLAAHLARAAGGDERLDAGDLRLAAERGAGRGHHAVGGARLRKARRLIGPETNQDSCDSGRTETNRRIGILRPQRTGNWLFGRSFYGRSTCVLRPFYDRGSDVQTKKAAQTFGRPQSIVELYVERTSNVRRTLVG